MLIKAFRLFVSSTFADLAREREVLQSKVFPALDAYCAAKGYQFHAIDLRWGVNEEAQLDQRTAEICLGEVAAAKRYPSPNFLIMVGDRYGWVPLPFAIPQDEFEAATAWLAEHGRAGNAGDLRKVYRLDENHLVPPGLAAAAGSSSERIGAYTLRSREDEIREYGPPKAWQELEDRLRGALQETADHLLREGRIGESACAKYFLSLTEQEIIRGLAGYPSAPNGAQAATLQPDNDGPQAIAWIRQPAARSLLRRMLGVGPRAPTAVTSAVERVRTRIRQVLPADSVLSGCLEEFAARIESRLRAAIDSHVARFEAEVHSELVQERAQHEDFAGERRRVFVGRDINLEAVDSYLAGESPHPLVLFGPSGLGKSALMARAVAEAEESGRGVPVVYRFVGASAASADVRSLLVSIVEDFVDRGIVTNPEQWEDDANKFDEQVRMLLKSIDRPAVVFIDALDQFKKPYRLGWLPDRLPPQLRVVVSVLDDAAYEEDSGVYRALRQRLPSEAFLEIELLTARQGRDILLALEAGAQRRLQASQRDYVLGRFEAAGASPLYLRVAFEIARGWRSWDETGQGRSVLAGDTAALVGQIIADLTSVHHHEPTLVTRTLGYLVAAKDGLSDREMTEVLSADTGVMTAISRAAEKHGVRTPSIERHGARKPKLPDSVWVRLHRQLAPLLVEKRVDEQSLLQFFHRQLADIARERHYAPAKAAFHGALADYFDAGVATADKDATTSGRKTYARRSLSELPYQLFHAGRRGRLDQILMGPDWMRQKLAAAGPRALIDDYRYAHTKAQMLTGQTLELAVGVLARDKRQLVPQILGRMHADLTDGSAEAVMIAVLLRNGRALVSPPMLAPRWATFTAPGGPEVRRFEGHGGAVNAVAFSPDGRHIVSGSSDHTLRLWDVSNGTSRVLEGHGDPVNAVAFSPDDRLIVSGDDDGMMRLWDILSGGSRELQGYEEQVSGAAFSPDCRQIVSGSYQGSLRLWEVASGTARELKRSDHSGVHAVAFSPDGCHFIYGSEEGTLGLWEVASGALRALEGHGGAVNAVAFSPDGRYIVSGSSDRTLRLWEVASGASRALEGHGSAVNAVTFAPDGRHVVSGSADGTLRLWEVARTTPREREGNSGVVNSVAFSPDGRHIVSGSSNGTLRLWEVASGASRALEDHGGAVKAVAFSPDGRHVVSGATDGALRLWEVASRTSQTPDDHGGAVNVNAVAFSPDGRLVVSGRNDGTLRLWEVARGSTRTLEGHDDPVNGVAFSPDSCHIVSGAEDATLRLWKVETGREIMSHDMWTDPVASSRDGRHLAGATSWRARLREISRRESRSSRAVGVVAFSVDGRHVVYGCADGTLRLWEVASGTSQVLDDHGGAVNAVAVSPDGRHVVCARDDGTMRLWEVASGRELACLDGDTSFRAVHLAPDGKSLAAGDSGGRVHLIDILIDEADKAAWLARRH